MRSPGRSLVNKVVVAGPSTDTACTALATSSPRKPFEGGPADRARSDSAEQRPPRLSLPSPRRGGGTRLPRRAPRRSPARTLRLLRVTNALSRSSERRRTWGGPARATVDALAAAAALLTGEQTSRAFTPTQTAPKRAAGACWARRPCFRLQFTDPGSENSPRVFWMRCTAVTQCQRVLSNPSLGGAWTIKRRPCRSATRCLSRPHRDGATANNTVNTHSTKKHRVFCACCRARHSTGKRRARLSKQENQQRRSGSTDPDADDLIAATVG